MTANHTSETDLAHLEHVRVFFGHQSVGENILDGVRDLCTRVGRAWPIVLEGEQVPRRGGVLLHARVGRNEQPLSKLEDFRRLLDEGLGQRVDLALLKFCYIDINERTDVEALFEAYRTAIDDLARRHPTVSIVPVTSPIRHVPGGLGIWARELLGRPNRAKLANRQRQRFNELIRSTYAGRPIIDVAASQSTRPDGRRDRFQCDGTSCDNLVSAYTDDGGHLNTVGRVAVASAFVRGLAEAAAQRASSVPAR